MSSKRNHAIRSHKTYRRNMYGARRFLHGSRPYAERKALLDLLRGAKPEQIQQGLEMAAEAAEEEAVA